ncbi:MAG: methylmalonyl Co-A mutase-associated GTPase MeaB [Dialister sp.]|nr:methylmalonyl Co-A mutase-associated GTPase MeaB [Dialister sp.]
MEFSMKDFWDGSKRALARAITIVENERDGYEDIMKEIYHHTGRAQVIGITGAPGAGKSTLSGALIKLLRKQGKTVGIVAIDPTSPFSGGAILGDRIRMNDLTLDKGVYIRSMGTRGSLGGLSKKTADAVKLMDAFGLDVILIETVGVGQSEVDIVKNADTTLVVLVPGLGDDIQAIKAGILEIGDVFCINKCDRDGADRLNVEIEMMLDLGEAQNWRPPIERTIASKNQGIEEVVTALGEHRKYLEESGVLEERRRERIESEMLEMIHDRISRHILEDISKTGEFTDSVEKTYDRETDPYTVVDSIVGKIFK